MKKINKVTLTLFKSLFFERKFTEYTYDGINFEMHVQYAWRWYNPLFLIMSIAILPGYLIFGGLKEWKDDLKQACSFDNAWTNEFKGNFKAGNSILFRTIDLWMVSYLGA
jgi:hypothetical protein